MSAAQPESGELLPEGQNLAISALTAPVALEAIAEDDIVSGEPQQGFTELGSIAGAEVGIWELRSGVVTDTEVDELFIVLSGEATIEILSGDDAGREVTVRTGDTMRLVGGTRTKWTVGDHIRKVYIAAE
ncbi:putative cupin superfamily protein [Leucobacter exalbidus]|uniref:Cupin superfamily protein n=1 Tax=Leucobacter exalbidus TaxID=662960 RepID=A0A940T6L3_9MICO|nr:putative cupin superfamily protein [Leucobacter exalbidus]